MQFEKELLQFISDLKELGVQEFDKDQRIEMDDGSIYSVHLNDLDIDKLPRSILNLGEFKMLNLENNNFSFLPDFMEEMTYLETLILGNNRFTEFPEVVFNLSLRMLTLNGNDLHSLPLDIITYWFLLLDLTDNPRLGNLGVKTTKYHVCFGMDQSYDKIHYGQFVNSLIIHEINKYIVQGKSLSGLIDQLQKLKNTKYSYKNIALPKYISHIISKVSIPKELTLIKLTTPGFSSQITSRYEKIKESNPILEELEVVVGERIPHYETLPIDMVGYTSYQRRIITGLNLCRSGVNQVPVRIAEFHGLEQLVLDHNDIDVLPEEILEMPNLRLLSLRNNRFDKFPEDISSVTRLEHLILSENKIPQVEVILARDSNLRTIHLEACEVKNFEITCDNVIQIEELNLANNPKLIIDLTQLNNSKITKLDLSQTELRNISKDLYLPELLELDLSNNQLTEIPELHNFPKLESIDLTNNNISSLNEILQTKPGELVIKISGNPLDTQEIEALKKNINIIGIET